VDHPAYPQSLSGLQNVTGSVDLDIPIRPVRLQDISERRSQVIDQIATAHGGVNIRSFGDRSGQQRGPGAAQILIEEAWVDIEASHLVTPAEQSPNQMGAHETGPTSDQDLHARLLP
jgi:hypothetical protein